MKFLRGLFSSLGAQATVLLFVQYGLLRIEDLTKTVLWVIVVFACVGSIITRALMENEATP